MVGRRPRRIPVQACQVELGAVIQQQLDNLERLYLRGHAQWRVQLAILVIETVGIGTVLQEQADALDVIQLDGHVDQRPT